MSTTATHPVIDQAKSTTDQNLQRLLKTFSFVPDDKLTWQPSPTSKSPLQIVAHCAVSNAFFSRVISGEPIPPGDPSELAAKRAVAEAQITTREAAIEAAKKSSDEVVAALDSMSPESVNSIVSTPFGELPMTFWMFLPARHLDNHASQIDYIQTCWGDMDWHF